MKNGDVSKRPFYTSALKCFCTFEKANETPDNLVVDRMYTNPDNVGGDKIPICKAYFADAKLGQFLSIMITIIIIMFN